MIGFGIDWTKDERERIIESSKKVLSSYKTMKRRALKMLQTQKPDIKSPAFSDMPKSQNLTNLSEDRMMHYLAAQEEAIALKEKVNEIERSINGCQEIYSRILRLKFMEGRQDDGVWQTINYGKTWYYEVGLPEALCEFAETWEFGTIPRKIKSELLAN